MCTQAHILYIYNAILEKKVCVFLLLAQSTLWLSFTTYRIILQWKNTLKNWLIENVKIKSVSAHNYKYPYAECHTTTLIGASACEYTCSLPAQQLFLLLHWFIILQPSFLSSQNHYDSLQLKILLGMKYVNVRTAYKVYIDVHGRRLPWECSLYPQMSHRMNLIKLTSIVWILLCIQASALPWKQASLGPSLSHWGSVRVVTTYDPGGIPQLVVQGQRQYTRIIMTSWPTTYEYQQWACFNAWLHFQHEVNTRAVAHQFCISEL